MRVRVHMYICVYNIFFLVHNNKNILSILSNPLAKRLDGKNFLSGFCPVFCPHCPPPARQCVLCLKMSENVRSSKAALGSGSPAPVPAAAPNCSQNQERLVLGEGDFTHSTGRPRRVSRRPLLYRQGTQGGNSSQLVGGKPLKVTKKVTICAFCCDFSPENSKNAAKVQVFGKKKYIMRKNSKQKST